MRNKLNCPNCGAPISDTQCPYCGAVFYDFAILDTEKPTYIRMNCYGRIITFRARMQMVAIDLGAETASNPNVNIEFDIYPDSNGVLFSHKQILEER